jgi:hypothetical protein
MTKNINAYNFTLKTINGCKTLTQLKSTKNMIGAYGRLFQNELHTFTRFQRLQGVYDNRLNNFKN